MVLAGRRGRLACACFLCVWLIGFLVMVPTVFYIQWVIGEYYAVGDLAPNMPARGKCAVVTLVMQEIISHPLVLTHHVR
jgi:hypothetical protein